VGLHHEARQSGAHPVVAAGHALRVVHPLLDHGPFPRAGEEEAVVVELEAVLKGGVVHLGGQAAGLDQGVGGAPQTLAVVGDLLGGATRGGPLAATGVQAQFVLQAAADAFLEGAAGGGGDAAGVPVEAEHATEGLEPVGVGQPQEEFARSVFGDDVTGDLSRQAGHAFEQPACGDCGIRRGRGQLHGPAVPVNRIGAS